MVYKLLYVELGSIDPLSKTIKSVETLYGKAAPSRARNVVRSNDVIYATVRPYYRNVAIIPPNLDNQICSTGFCVLRAYIFKSGICKPSTSSPIIDLGDHLFKITGFTLYGDCLIVVVPFVLALLIYQLIWSYYFP